MLGSSTEDDDPLLRHNKLCGFFCAVLNVNSLPNEDSEELIKTLAPGTICTLVTDGTDVRFHTDGGVMLLPIQAGEKSMNPEDNMADNCWVSTPNLKRIKVVSIECGSSSRKKRRGIGLAHGSMSAVHQLHALMGHKCLKIIARMIRVSVREGDVRAVVLVDVYLPFGLWSGWQFPRSGTMAASLFRHLSCNWEQRNSLLVCGGNHDKNALVDEECIWNHSDCHVLGCKMHCNVSGSVKKGLFELHEIFKSLPGVDREGRVCSTTIQPANASLSSGIWEVSDDVLTNVLAGLGPKDLVRVAATCRHLRSLAVSIMPCMKLKLFPHQEAAVGWMLQRERTAEVLPHPLFMDFLTEDGFPFYINAVSGEISTGMAPTVTDFCGGMFCDEPGLGKTVTALSLILKTHGTLPDPPCGVEVIWCTHNPNQRCGYYELSASNLNPANSTPTWKRLIRQNGRRGHTSCDKSSPECSSMGVSRSSKRARLKGSEVSLERTDSSYGTGGITSSTDTLSLPATRILRCTRRLGRAKRNLLHTYETNPGLINKKKIRKNLIDMRHISSGLTQESLGKPVNRSPHLSSSSKKRKKARAAYSDETWVQCDACRKWRKLSDGSIPDATAAWFCSMNSDLLHKSCYIPEESWGCNRSITHLPGFYTKGTPQGKEQNVSFFTSVLKEHYTLMNSETKKALTWLVKLSSDKLLEMETVGLTRPVLDTRNLSDRDAHDYHKIFQAFGLIRKVERGTSRWYYPRALDNLALDLTALQISLTKPLNLFRLYLSRATLIVVPANLVDHWKTQILKHVSPGQLRIYIWTDHKKPPSTHNLAWDYDIVITTFNRLSAEWGPRKRSILMQVHWLRIMLDEGHTLGSSLNLTNKLQMATSLAASNRWILTGTPTPNTPSSQVAHLLPMLKFLNEEAYGQNQKSWEAGILRPFEAEMEEGRSRLLQLLRRCMISARKIDLRTIPPCIKKVTFLDFTEEHAKTYNELVVTVRRNILMADWNDPSHVESLLNPKQWKLRSNTIRNVRLSCCVAGHIKVAEAGHDIQETMDILEQQGLDPVSEEYVLIKYSLLNGCSCCRCKEWCRLPVITPCRHLLCLDCVALDSERCTFPGCGNSYEMQSPETLARPENPNPKWPVPKDLIELQPSYKQDDWDPDWHATLSSKVSYLVKRLKFLQETNLKKGYCMSTNDLIPRGEEGLLSNTRPVPIHWNVVIYREANTKLNAESYEMLPEKVIVFSQFLEHIHVIEQQLTGAAIKYTGLYSPMHSSNKMKSLMMFQHDLNCMVLLMDGSAALGLDLSFVTHVFLMEPIWDRSMEEQVISRAHRMGATRPIHVETLAMRGTVEEQMLEFLQDADERRRTSKQDFCRTDNEGARAHRTLHDFAESNYLAQLSFVRTNVNI